MDDADDQVNEAWFDSEVRSTVMELHVPFGFEALLAFCLLVFSFVAATNSALWLRGLVSDFGLAIFLS